MYEICIIADDLTGAMDTGHGFAAQSHPTVVQAVPRDLSRHTQIKSTQVSAINTDSRYDSKEDASRAVEAVVRSVDAQQIYKKIDSTLRGNIVAEVQAVLRATDTTAAIVAPAFPAAGRTTENAVQYVNGRQLAKTEYTDDPKAMKSADLIDMFGQSPQPTKHVELATVTAGEDRTRGLISKYCEVDMTPIIICDATDDTHLQTIARATATQDVLYIGSGGLAKAITIDEASSEMAASANSAETSAMGIVGSVSDTAFTQLKSVSDDQIVCVDGPTLCTDGTDTTAVSIAIKKLRQGQTPVLTAATGPAMVERTQDAGKQSGLSPTEIRSIVATGLATTAAAIINETRPAGIFMTGGDVAVEVLKSIETSMIQLTGAAVGTGAPHGRAIDGPHEGIPVITKPGGFGNESTIVNCLGYLETNDA